MRRLALLVVLSSVIGVAGCGDNNDAKPDAAGHPGSDAARIDAPGSDGPHDGPAHDGPPIDAPPAEEVVTCQTLTAGADTCSITPGSAATLLVGNVMTPSTVYVGGKVLVDATGKIACTGCDCGTGGETVITCADAAISPGLINTHDHITYTQNLPHPDAGIRYEDRQQWREGATNRPKITTKSGATADAVRWGELRFLMGGATSIVGSGGEAGLLRNLDQAANEGGLGQNAVKFDTFPLDDASATKRTADCNYGGTATTPASISTYDAYEPHTSEGIDTTAHNEFLCESSATYDTEAPGLSNNLVLSKTAMIHAIGLAPHDYQQMATAHTSLIWSPRSNIVLYGDTARVREAATLGVNIALGTDWMPSGSHNLLRELACADSFNHTYLNGYFSDKQLWEMVTKNAALVTKMDDVIGSLATGKVADIAIFAAHGKTAYRAVLDAKAEDVALVMRGGKVLYGDVALVTGSGAASCDTVDVCGTSKGVCTKSEVNETYMDLMTNANKPAAVYPAFLCDVPADEPSCTPMRPEAVSGSTIYTGVPNAGVDSDGDGIADAHDNCPTVFNPVRPMDAGVQGDADGDGVGDACDPCPLDANTTTCTVGNPNDRDGDGVNDDVDNCPDIANTAQTDSDGDHKGDACDACPHDANEGSAGCPVTIYDIKKGTVPVGEAVHVSNALVTGKGSNGFFVQIKLGDTAPLYVDEKYSGMFVFTTGAPLAAAVVGQRVAIDGAVDSFNGELELDAVSAVTPAPGGAMEAPPLPVMVDYGDLATGTRAAELEGVIVKLGPATVTALDTTNVEFTLTAATGHLQADDFLYAPNPPIVLNQAIASAAGVLAFRNSAYKLEPRGATDLVLGAPDLASLSPATVYVRASAAAGTSSVPELVVTLTGPAQGDTMVTILSNDTAALDVVSPVTVKDTETTAVVKLTPHLPSAGVTVTAMFGVQMKSATVVVLDDATTGTVVSLTPVTSSVAAGGAETMTVSLDVPAAADTPIGLAATAGGTVPATVTIAKDTLSTTFAYTEDATATADVTVTATLGPPAAPISTATATVSALLGSGHLVINEVDYDQPGDDTAEFIELYNGTGVAVDLTNLAVLGVNGATGQNKTYLTVPLASAGSLPNGYYLVIGTGETIPATATKSIALMPTPAWTSTAGSVQNGPPDGLALVDLSTHTVIDALSYEGPMTAEALGTGFPASVSLVEGTVLPTATADSGAGSLCRSPDGTDTDNAANDWKLCATITPGSSNTP